MNVRLGVYVHVSVNMNVHLYLHVYVFYLHKQAHIFTCACVRSFIYDVQMYVADARINKRV